MYKLSEALTSFIYSKMASDSHWKDIRVFLSDSNVPGQGEHKIMSFIRGQRSLPEYNPNTRHCLFSSDTDFIMLALATHEPYFSILRKNDQLLDILILREYLQLEMKSMNLERIIDDFVFICFLAGNDFLPTMPTLDVHEGAFDLLIDVYKNSGLDYLVDITRIGEAPKEFVNLPKVENFILKVGTYESQIFKKRAEVRRNKKHFGGQKRAVSLSDLESGSSSAENSDIQYQILQNTLDLKKELQRCMDEKSDLLKTGDYFTDNLKLATLVGKTTYYRLKFSAMTNDEMQAKRVEVVQKYTEGLVWVLQYYFSQIASWSWFYPYYYGPFASDMEGMSEVEVEFEKGEPFSPFDQLLCILPPTSAYCLPRSYSRLMTDDDSKILEWYPHDFEVDIEGKHFFRQGICKLPFIDEELLLTQTREISGLSANEMIRNSVKVDRVFFTTSHEDGDCCVCNDYDEVPAWGTSHTPHLLSGLILPQQTIHESDLKRTRLWHESHQSNRRR